MAEDVIEVMVEVPAGTRNKYAFDEDLGALVLDRQLPSSLVYPADYGFIPRTLAEDGDALDALVLLDEPTFPGCIVRMRPLGVLCFVDGDATDHKIVGVLPEAADSDGVHDLSDVSSQSLASIEQFFRVYKDLEEGERIETFGYDDRAAALLLIAESRARFERRSGLSSGQR